MTPEQLVALYGTCGTCGAPRETMAYHEGNTLHTELRCSANQRHDHEGFPVVWHDEIDRWAETGQLDPPDRCLCPECSRSSDG